MPRPKISRKKAGTVIVRQKQTRPRYKKKPKYKPSVSKDGKQKALPPGTRVSKNGKLYREYRSNRSDFQKKRKPYL